MKNNFYARRYIVNILDYNDKIYFYDSLNMKKTEHPKIMNTVSSINFNDDRLEGTSRITKLKIRLFNNFDKTSIEIQINNENFIHVIDNNMNLSPLQFMIQSHIYDETNKELEYPLLLCIIPDINNKSSWLDIADNMDHCICEIRCYEIIFTSTEKNYVILSNIGIDKNMVPRNKMNYGFVLYGNTFSELYLWTIISKIKDS